MPMGDPLAGGPHPDGAPGDGARSASRIRGALIRYRVMAWVVGLLLVVLFVGVLRYLPGSPPGLTDAGEWISEHLGVLHGWLYLALLITAADLGRRVRWPWWRLLVIALAGTVPFLSFVAERYATRDVLARLRAAGSADSPAAPSDQAGTTQRGTADGNATGTSSTESGTDDSRVEPPGPSHRSHD